MELIIRSIIIAVFCSLLALVLHLGINFFRKGRHPGEAVIFELARQAKISLLSWLIVFILFIFLFFKPPALITGLGEKILGSGLPMGYAYGIILYVFLCFLYLSAYYLIDRSVSATLLEIIEQFPEGEVDGQKIKEIYGIHDKYLSELKGMCEGGFIIEEAGFYHNSFKGRLYAKLASAVKSILKLGPGG